MKVGEYYWIKCLYDERIFLSRVKSVDDNTAIFDVLNHRSLIIERDHKCADVVAPKPVTDAELLAHRLRGGRL